jgi:nucleoside phosphorylase
MKVLVTFALENEFAPWRKLRQFQRVPAGSSDRTYVARVGDAEVRVILTGVGRFPVQRAIARAFDYAPDACIASGLCGGLKPIYRPGAILAARAVGDARGTKLIRSNDDLISLAGDAGATVVERFLASDQVLSTAEAKTALSKFGDAADMESLYILAAAEQRGVRSVAIRAVSDASDSNLPLDFGRTLDGNGRVSVGRVFGQILARPPRIGGLLRLAHESQRAAAALASFLDEYIQGIASGSLQDNVRAGAMAI